MTQPPSNTSYEDLDSTSSVALTGKLVFAEQFQIFLDHEAGTLSGDDIEDLHKMRVATRRMRALLKSLRDFYDPDQVRFLRDSLKNIAQRLGELRDIDSFLLFLSQCESQIPSSIQPAIHHIIEDRRYAREQQLQKLRVEFTQNEYLRFKDEIHSFIQINDEAENLSPSIKMAIPALLEKLFDKIIKKKDRIYEATIPELHRLRINFKRLRYLCEFFSPWYDKSMDKIIQDFISYQDILGDIHDHHRDILFLQESQERIFAELGSENHSQSLRDLIQHYEQILSSEKEKFYELWPFFTLEENEIRYRYFIRHGIE